MTFHRNNLREITFVVALACCSLTGCAQRPPSHVLTYGVNTSLMPAGKTPDARNLVMTLNDRLDRAGRLGHAHALNNDQVAIDIYRELDASELDSVKRLISSMGVLEFRITAQPSAASTADTVIINNALALLPTEKAVIIDGEQRAEWVSYAQAEFGQPNVADGRIVKRMAGATPEALVLTDSWNVTGDFLTSATKGSDDRGQPAIHFSLNPQGAARFRQLTGQNLPNPATGSNRHLGILLDKHLLSAPMINSVISDRAVISGGAMTEREVDHIIAILNAGALPYPIQLVSEGAAPATAAAPLGGRISPVLIVLAAGFVILLVVAGATLAVKLR